MKNLNVYTIDAIDHLVQPDEFNETTEESSALAIISDFKHHRPHLVEAHLSAIEARDLMLQENVNLKLVVDAKQEFVGLIGIEDLSDQSIILTQMSQGVSREEVLVADLMHPRGSVRAINYEDLQGASIADIIYTLQRHGQHYYIVVDHDQHHIRGVVSAAEISRRLHHPIAVEKNATVVEMLSAKTERLASHS